MHSMILRSVILVALLAGVAQAGPYLIRAQRGYDSAVAIVETAERESKDAVRHRLLVRAAPIMRQAKLWYRFAQRAGDESDDLAGKLRDLEVRITLGRKTFIAPTDRAANPVVPDTGTIVVIEPEAKAEVAGGDRNEKRLLKRDELDAWRVRRTLARVGTRMMRLQRARLQQLQAARRAQLLGEKNVARVEKRKELDAWRMARIEERVSR